LDKKLRFLEIAVIASRTHFSLAKTFLQSYQGISAIFKAWRTCYPNFFGDKFIIHQGSYLGKQWVVWGK